MAQIGAQIQKTRDVVVEPALAAMVPEGGGGGEGGGSDDGETDTVETMRRRRSAYYTVTHKVHEEVRQPSIMVNGTLKPYQLEGLRWMVSLYNNNLNGILADEMGLGKTIQTISLVTYLIEAKSNAGPYLIIVPLSTLGNWVREFDKWAPSVVKVIYRGDAAMRRNIYDMQMALGGYNVVLTTYEFVVRDQAVLAKTSWKYIIIDEGHRMKNANSKMAMTLGVRYRSQNRILLTGTPLQNNLTELWALLNFLLPSIFSSADTFEQWFKKPFEQTTMGDAAELEEEETYLIINRLHQVLRPFLLRRLKTDVESQLPDKVETVIRCDMSVWQRVLYRQMQRKISVATGEDGGGNGRRFNNLLMQLKKICNHPFIFYGAEEIAKLPEEMLIRSSGKFVLLAHMLAKLKRGNHRTLIFSQMTTALDYMEDFMCAIGVRYMRLDGNTKADDRQEMLNEFNAEDSPYFCFLLSTRAGGLGLNLQTADTVIIFDSDWNPMMDLQAQDRAHRIGQTKEVRVIRLISAGTVEVKILDQANRKLQVDAQVIQAGQFNNKATDTDRETMLKSILRQQTDELDNMGDRCPDKEDVNRMLARSDEEFEMYQEIDEERVRTAPEEEMMVDESELPPWVLQPEVDHKTTEEAEQEAMLTHGRGRRKHAAVQDADQLTEKEWLDVMEGDISLEAALARRKNRIERRRTSMGLNGSSAANSGDDGDDDDEVENDSDDDDAPLVADDSSDGGTRRRRRGSHKSRAAPRPPVTTKRRRSSTNVVDGGAEEDGGGDEGGAGSRVKRRRMNGTTPVANGRRGRPSRSAASAAPVIIESDEDDDDRPLANLAGSGRSGDGSWRGRPPAGWAGGARNGDSGPRRRRRSVVFSDEVDRLANGNGGAGSRRGKKLVAPADESDSDADVGRKEAEEREDEEDEEDEDEGCAASASPAVDGKDADEGNDDDVFSGDGADTDGGADEGRGEDDAGGGSMRTRLRLRVRPPNGR
jgi:ATP-dependent helicase STH1/SNF2